MRCDMAINESKTNNNLSVDDTIKNKKKAIAELIEKAKGNRTYSEYAQDSGISNAAMSRIIKGDYLPTIKTIQKLTSESAKPQNNVTYESFRKILENSDIHGDDVDAEDNNQYNEKPDNKDKKYLREHKPTVRFIFREMSLSGARRFMETPYQQYSHACIANIYDTLLGKEVRVKPNQGNITDIPVIKSQLYLDVFDQAIKRWCFYFLYCSNLDSRVNPSTFFGLLGELLRIKPDPDTKFSLIINHLDFYDWMQKYDHILGFRGELSLVLFDEETGKLTKEFYLSNYEYDNREREIYIV